MSCLIILSKGELPLCEAIGGLEGRDHLNWWRRNQYHVLTVAQLRLSQRIYLNKGIGRCALPCSGASLYKISAAKWMKHWTPTGDEERTVTVWHDMFKFKKRIPGVGLQYINGENFSMPISQFRQTCLQKELYWCLKETEIFQHIFRYASQKGLWYMGTINQIRGLSCWKKHKHTHTQAHYASLQMS